MEKLIYKWNHSEAPVINKNETFSRGYSLEPGPAFLTSL